MLLSKQTSTPNGLADEGRGLRIRGSDQRASALITSPPRVELSARQRAVVKTGAEDGSEMGALSFLKAPQREANLQEQLAEYTPAAMDVGIIFAN